MRNRNNWWLWVLIGGGLLLATGGLMGYSVVVRRIAWAIANAERGPDEIASGVIARNNPGDIEDSVGNLITYPTLQDGWNALYHQVQLFFSGSHLYNPNMTIADIAQKYVGTSDWVNWASNVADYLGVPVDTQLKEI